MLAFSLTLATTVQALGPLDAVPLWLAPGEHLRWQGFGNIERRQQFLAGRWLLRCLVAELRGGAPESQVIEIDEQGRSHLAEGLFASLSHSGPWLAVVLSERPIGLDVERLRPRRDVLGLARMVHSPAQCERLTSLDGETRLLQFYRWWTLKEAWLKRQGQGLDFKRMRALEFEPTEAEQAQALSLFDAERRLVLALDGDVRTTEVAGFGSAQHLRYASLVP